MSDVRIELDLNEEGYRRLCGIAEGMARHLPAFTLGDALVLVVETGTATVEARLASQNSPLIIPH